MATSPRAQELAEQLLGMEATRLSMPAEKRHFQGMNQIKAFVQRNKKAVIVGTVIVGAIAVYAGVIAYKKKHPTPA